MHNDEGISPTFNAAWEAIRRITKGCVALRLNRKGSPTMRLSELLEDVKTIDLYLTGKTNNRNHDEAAAEDCLLGGEWMVYLSDGGYTRLVIAPHSKQTLRLTGQGGGSASWQGCLKRYREIGGRFIV